MDIEEAKRIVEAHNAQQKKLLLDDWVLSNNTVLTEYGEHIVDCATKEIAEHIVKVHNTRHRTVQEALEYMKRWELTDEELNDLMK